MNTITAFLSKYSITTHSFVVVGLFLLGAYNFDTQFHNLVLQVYGYFPVWLRTLTETVIGLVAFYKTWQKPTS